MIDSARQSLNWKVLLYILMFSSIFTILATGTQLYLEYQDDLGRIEERLVLVEKSYSESLAEAIWDVDESLVRTQLTGIKNLVDIQYVALEERTGELSTEIGASGAYSIKRTFSLEHAINETETVRVGTLTVVATLDNVHKRIYRTFLVILATQAIRTFIVSTFIFFLTYFLITRHLVTVSNYSRNLNMDNLNAELALNRYSGQNRFDELDEVVYALNSMRLGLKQEIEARKETEQQLRQAQKMEAMGTLAGGIAHDFNNLLAPIMGYTDLMKRRVEPGSKEEKYLSSIDICATRASDLVNKILVISRKTPAIIRPLQVGLLLEEVLAIIKASVPPDIHIQKEVAQDLPDIDADPSQIYQVILNLCMNAVQAMPDGGNLAIKLDQKTMCHNQTPERDGETRLCLTIQDNGEGMTPEVIERMYDPFFTTRGMGEKRGTGLGLAIVDSIVQHHKGRIEVESQPGQGTTFRIFFPVVDEAQKAAPVSAPPRPTAPVKSRHILVVDDEAQVCSVCVEMLEELGYSARAFFDSRDALEAFRENSDRFDLVITDYSMEYMNGPQLIQHIKAIRSDVPVLMITGYSHLASPDNLQKWDCVDMLAKPYKAEDLIQAVERIFSAS